MYMGTTPKACTGNRSSAVGANDLSEVLLKRKQIDDQSVWLPEPLSSCEQI